jgi:hypothetical protein
MGVPDGIEVRRDIELVGRRHHGRLRRALLGALTVIPALALLNVFGQRPTAETSAHSGAALEVYAPSRLRGGVLYMARFTITAHAPLRRPTLVLDSGWAEGMQINTVAPAPSTESSRDGKLAFEFADIPAGHRAVVFAQFQANPTNVGRRQTGVTLEAEDIGSVHVDRTITVFP